MARDLQACCRTARRLNVFSRQLPSCTCRSGLWNRTVRQAMGKRVVCGVRSEEWRSMPHVCRVCQHFIHLVCTKCSPAPSNCPKNALRGPEEKAFSLQRGEAIFSTSALENRNSNLLLDPDPAHTHTRTRKQGRRCKVDFPLRAFALVLFMEGLGVCGLPRSGRGLWTSAQCPAFWSTKWPLRH